MDEHNRCRDWLIRTAGVPPFVYDPRVHSRRYVWAYLDRVGASPMEAEDVLRQARELEERAVALGYELASEKFGEAALLHPPPPSFTARGPRG